MEGVHLRKENFQALEHEPDFGVKAEKECFFV